MRVQIHLLMTCAGIGTWVRVPQWLQTHLNLNDRRKGYLKGVGFVGVPRVGYW